MWTPVCMEPTLKYHPLMFDVLTLTRNPGCGQCLVSVGLGYLMMRWMARLPGEERVLVQ